MRKIRFAPNCGFLPALMSTIQWSSVHFCRPPCQKALQTPCQKALQSSKNSITAAFTPASSCSLASAMFGGEGVVFLDQPFTYEAIAFAIRKDNPDFLAWLNAFLSKLRADGRYSKIRSKWFESTDWFDLYR